MMKAVMAGQTCAGVYPPLQMPIVVVVEKVMRASIRPHKGQLWWLREVMRAVLGLNFGLSLIFL
ncbi:MAG: hypothetical protein RSC25_05000, partial [Christensenella sp.]